jgi:streptogramin lyase
MSTIKLFSGVKSRALLLLALFISLAGVCRAQTNIHEFTIYLADSGSDYFITPEWITYGQDGGYWFTMYSANKIGRFDPLASTNRISSFFITNGGTNTYPYGITRGPDTNLWFTESGNNRICRLDPFSSNYTVFTLPTPHSAPWTITTGPDGNIWFSEYNLNRIAAIAPIPVTNANGTVQLVQESPAIRTNSQIYGLTAGPDGNMWFMDGTWGVIYRFNLVGTNVGTLTPFSLPQTNCEPVCIIPGPDGALWFTEHASNKVARITTDGVVTEFPIPRPNGINPKPYAIIVGPDSNLWFTMALGSAIGRLTTNGIFTIFPTPTVSAFPTFLATGSPIPGTNTFDTNIYFCENVSGIVGVSYQNIGRLLVDESLNLDAPTTVNLTSGNTFSGLLASYQISSATNSVHIFWGDGTSNTVRIFSIAPNASATSNGVTITNIVGIDTNTGVNGSYQVFASHTYGATSNYSVTVVITDPRGDSAIAKIALPPPFFNGQVSNPNGVDYLQFPDGNVFGYYTLQYFPYVYHFDMGFEYFIDANDGQGGVYFYDFTSTHFFYTSPTLFPYLYDFSLNAWLYYYPDTSNPGHYTTNPRYFYNFGTSSIIQQ